MSIDLNVQINQTLSPRMLQSITILQMGADELDSFIEETALENPTMDVTARPAESITAHQWDMRVREETHYQSQRRTDDDFDPRDNWNFRVEKGESLSDHLWSQLMTRSFSPHARYCLDYMIRSLDSHGYMPIPLEEVCESCRIPVEKARELLLLLQSLEPTGICAQNLGECLRIQLQRSGRLTPALDCLITDHLDLLAKHKYAALSKALSLPVSEIEAMSALIRTLDPAPGRYFADDAEVNYLIPDVSVLEENGQLQIVLNESVYPSVTVNTYYKNMLAKATDGEVKEYLDKKISQTEWITQCLQQRRSTILSVTEILLRFQEDFFRKDPSILHPLRQTEVAEVLGVHESTISRAIDNKYLLCKWGVFPLSHFFPRNAVVTRGFQVGPEVSFTHMDVKRALHELVDGENKKKPYSDRILSEMLTEKGFTISRRTVAKYRDEEGIPDASGRKNQK